MPVKRIHSRPIRSSIHATWLFCAALLLELLSPLGCSHVPGAGQASSNESLGLVLVDCEIKWREFIPISTSTNPGAAFLYDVEHERAPILGKYKDGVIIFKNVPPSLYRLTRVDSAYATESGKKPGDLPTIHADVFEFAEESKLLVNVPPGGAVYFGQIIIKGSRPCLLDAPHGSVLEEDNIQMGWSFKIQSAPDRERKVWNKALGKKWSREWETQIRARLAEIG